MCLQASTGRFIPNAWPSSKMIENSAYLQGAMQKHWFSYLTGLFAISPVHVLGLLYVAVLLPRAVLNLRAFLKARRERVTTALSLQCGNDLAAIVFSAWPLAFVAGLTLIGVLGGGFQMRFMLPILPATSILAAIVIVNAGPNVTPLVCVLCCISMLHLFYYSVLYPPLFADIDISVFEILAHLLSSVLDDQQSKEVTYKMFQTMRHYGLVVR